MMASAASVALLVVPVVGAVALLPVMTTAAFAVKGHKHSHVNAHTLLGDKIHHDGKYDLGKLGNRKVSAVVQGGKVVDMSAGDLKFTKVKAHQKMAASESGLIRAGYRPGLQLAQYDSSDYYGYCTDDGYETTCYWWEASDIDPYGGYWEEYTTYDG
jgi:hypothetical protein